MWSPSIFTYVATDGTRTLTAGIRHIVEALWVQGVTQVQVDQPRLYNCTQVIVVNLKYAVHTRKNDDNAAIYRNGTTTQTCTRASWHYWHIVAVGNVYNEFSTFMVEAHFPNLQTEGGKR